MGRVLLPEAHGLGPRTPREASAHDPGGAAVLGLSSDCPGLGPRGRSGEEPGWREAEVAERKLAPAGCLWDPRHQGAVQSSAGPPRARRLASPPLSCALPGDSLGSWAPTGRPERESRRAPWVLPGAELARLRCPGSSCRSDEHVSCWAHTLPGSSVSELT